MIVSPEMAESDVLELYRAFESAGLRIWIDGGWGIDALLERRTRPHEDLDIVLEEARLGTLLALLDERGFREIPKEDSRAWNFVMGDGAGREIDLHVIVMDEVGNGLYGPRTAGESMYPAQALGGQGTVGGHPVRCTSAEFQLQSHSGYPLQDKDFRDVGALARHFGLEFPENMQGVAQVATHDPKRSSPSR